MTKDSKPRNTAGRIPIIIGLLLIAAALLLIAFNRMDDHLAQEDSHYFEVKIRTAMDTYEPPEEDAPESVFFEADDPAKRAMPTVDIDGYECLGILEIPEYRLSLPVLNDWDYKKLRKAPCRYVGSYYSDDLVICGHNYRTHFSLVKGIPIGAPVSFQAVDGTRYDYIVVNVEQMRPTEIERMVTDPGNDWDLTLFTCSTGGSTRCAVRCIRADDGQERSMP